jgi:glycine/betaine/sarcosine/D-proline reductase family selenoprotein B
VIDREIEKEGIPVVFITAMAMLAEQLGANRIVTGAKIPHPCGDPTLAEEADRALRLEIVKCALSALQSDVKGSTIFVPDVEFTSG